MRIKLYFVLLILSFLLTGNRMTKSVYPIEQGRFCEIYGAIAVVDDPRRAHFNVYVEDSEGLADIIVFEEEIRLYADREGIWHFTANPGLADYVVFFGDNKHFADFSIYYTDIESFARCQ